jgi:hypothetical protein
MSYYLHATFFHRPLVLFKTGLVRDTEDAEKSDFLIENREMPILDKPSGLRPINRLKGRKLFVCSGVAGTNKKLIHLFLCDLRVSVVKPINGLAKFP